MVVCGSKSMLLRAANWNINTALVSILTRVSLRVCDRGRGSLEMYALSTDTLTRTYTHAIRAQITTRLGVIFTHRTCGLHAILR